jgi:beta-glucosidase
MEASGQRPSFPFGFGLGYSLIEWGEPVLDHVAANASGSFTAVISVGLTNTGSTAGTEVVQVYLAQSLGSYSAPLLTLNGFKKVGIEAGGSATARVTLELQELPEVAFVGPDADPVSHRAVRVSNF